MISEQKDKESKYLYEIESLKKDETDISQVLLDIQNHIKDDEHFEYDRTILDKKNFIVTPNSIERIRKISYYISRGVPVLLEGPSGTSKTFSTEFSCLVAKTKRPLIRFNMSSDTVPADLLGKMVGDKNSLAGISSQEGHFLKAFKYGHPLLLDEINLASQAVLQCIEEALDSEVISIEIPGFPLTIIKKHPDFALIATQNPNKGLFANKRQNLGKKFMSKFQVITFPEFTEDELNRIAIGLAKNFGFKGDNKILEDLVKFHKKWASSEDIKDDVQCFTVREIAASVKAFSEGTNIYDTVMTIYGARYQKILKDKLEKLLRSYPSFTKINPDELTIPKNFPDCFRNKPLLEAIKSIKFSLDNNRHVIISGNEGSGKTQLALWFAEWYSKERNIKKNNIFYCLCTEELKCPDLIGRQSPTNSTDPGKELIEWKNGFLSNAIENGGVVVLDALDQASATVTERLNGLLDQKYDDTEKAKFDIPENPQKSEIIIHKNFRLVCTTDIHKINQMSPAFVNRFDVIVLEDQMESINEDEKKELIKFLLINSYKENRIKSIISKQEEVKEKENEPEINEELINIDFNAVQDVENNYQIQRGEEYYDQENQNEDENNMDECENNFNEPQEGGEDYLNFEHAGSEGFNFNQEEGEEVGKGEGEENQENYQANEEGQEENDLQNEDNGELQNIDNNINNEEIDKNQILESNKEPIITDESNKNENQEEKNINSNNENNEIEEKEIEETYIPTKELIGLVYSKSGEFKTIYKLNQFCRTIRIFILYFKDKDNISQDSIVDFCYNILTKDFEKGKLIEIDQKIEKILLDLNDEPDSDDPKYFYKNSKLLSNYIAILHACKIANIHLCVYGPPGAGKTSGTRAFGRIISKDPTKRFDFEMHSFHAGTKPSHYYGTTTLKEGKIFYKNGTLTNSLINGYMFIADELNLSSISNMNALAPALEMNLNISINFPGIEKPILIHPNFFFVVCQNEVGTIGRNTLPPNIIKRFKEIFYPPQQVEDIAQICKEINNSLYQQGEEKIITEVQAGKLGEYMIKLNSNNFSEISQWSLRDINKLFQRQIQQYKLPGVYNGISFCHNLLFYTMSSVSKEDIKNVKEKVIKIIQEVFGLSVDERNNLSECFNSKAELKNDSHGFLCIFKGTCSISFDLFKQIFITADKPNIEENPIMKLTSLLEDLFQISLTSDKEPILLIGPSGYKTFLAQKFLSNAKTITLNQESSVEQLLGSSSFFSKSEVNDFYLRLIVLICRLNNYKDLSQKLKEGNLKKEELDEIINTKKLDLPFSFIYALERCRDKIFEKKREDDEANALSNMIIEFRPGLFLTAILGGSCLILKNLSNLPTIILERFNELFSGKCNITVNEDIPNTITPESKKELSEFNKNFRVFGTCPPGATSQLSEAVISRFSLIYVGEYAPDEQKTVLQSYCDLNNLNTITDDNINNIIEFSQSLNTSFSGINMTLYQMINLLQLAHNINLKLQKSRKYSFMTKDIVLSLIIYYSARGLLDNRESRQLKRLCDIVGLNKPPEENIEELVSPLYIDEEEGVKGLRSKITQLIIKSPLVNEKEKDIAFTNQFSEMVEIIHFGLANNVPVILEGMPGQGKQLCINYIAELLGYEVINIMISQSTKVEDLLGKNIITKDKNKNIKVLLNETKLSKALKKQTDNDQAGKQLIFVFNNLNNASPAVLELLTSIFDKNQENVLLSDGSTIPKNPINIIGILKPQNGANRDKLPPTLLYSSLYHIVLEPEENSIKQIIAKKLEKEIFKGDDIKLYNNYLKAKDIIEKKYQKENFLNLNDITKFINFRKISYGKIDDVDIIFAMVFVYRFTEEEIISDLKKELHIQSIDMKPTLIYDMPVGTLTYTIGEKNKIQIKTYFEGPLTGDEITNLKNIFIPLTSNQKSCILFLILCALTKRACIIQGETASGKSHVIRTFAQLVGKKLNVYQLNSESSTSLLTGQSTLNTRITKEESIELVKIFCTLESFEQIKDKMNEKFPQDKYEEWSAESFKELIELIKNVEQRGTADDKEILRKARIEIGKIIIPANRFNNECDSAFVVSLKNGSWDLFDGMESSPPQLSEKISTLAGEEPELDLYETGKDNYFFTRKKNIPNSTLIHEDFLMFICHNISTQNDKSLDPSLLSKCNCFCMPPVDSKEIDSAQMLYGSFIKNGLERKICQTSATRFSFVHKFVKDKSKVEEDSFSGDLQPTGRTLGFIGKEFHKYFESYNGDSSLQLYKPICHSLVSFYANSYNPAIKEEEGTKSLTEKERSEKENTLKQKFVTELIDKFRNYVPDFTLDEVSQSEKYLDILSFLKSIQEFAVFGQPKNSFDFDFRNFIVSSIDKIELGDIDLIIKHLSDTIILLTKMEIQEKDKVDRMKEKDLYYQINLYNELLKDIQSKKSLVSDQYIGRKLSDKELLLIEELKVPLSRLHLFEGFIKNNEIFSGNIKSCLFENNLTILTSCIVEFFSTKNMLSFKKLLNILKYNPHLFKLMDLVFPYKHFSDSILNNVTFLMDLFSKLYLAGINFKVTVDNAEFLFQSSKKIMRMICYFNISHKFLIDINSRFERILTKDGKPTILFKIIPKLIKDPNKDYISYNYYMYTTILNIIQKKKEDTINENETKKLISECLNNKSSSIPKLEKNQEPFYISRFINSNDKTSLFGKCWGCVLNFNDNFLKYIKYFCNTIERHLINLADILNKIIEPIYIDPILNLCESMKEFSKPNSILWQISTKQFKPEPSKANIYNELIKKEKAIVDNVFNQEIQFNENIKADFQSCFGEAQKEIDKLILIDVKDEKERKIKEKLQKNKIKLDNVQTKDNKIKIVKNQLSAYISQYSENTSLLTEEVVNDITEKVDHFIELSKQKEIAKEENLIDWPDSLVKQSAPNETDNIIRLEILLWYSKIMKEIKFIDSDIKNNLLKSVMKLNENNEILPIINLLMNMNDGKISDIDKKNQQIIFGTLNAIFIYKLYKQEKTAFLWDMGDYINSFKRREEINDPYFISKVDDNIKSLEDKFFLYVPKFKKSDLLFLFINVTKNDYQGNREYKLGPLLEEFRCSQVIAGLNPMVDKLLSSDNNKTILEIIDDIAKVIYLNYLNRDGKEEDLKSHEQILESLKNIKFICNKQIEELKQMQRDKSNEIFAQENKIKASEIILTIFDLAKLMNDKFPLYNLEFDDLDFFKEKLDEEFINNYPTLFYFFNKNMLTYQQLKDNFIVAYKTKKLYEGQNEFYHSFYFWIFCLRILSSINCICLDQYNDSLNEFATNEVKKIIKEKMNRKEKFGTKWINILLDNIDPIYEDSYILSIYKYVKKIIGYSSNVKIEFKEESISLLKKVLLYLIKHVFDDSINDFLQKDFSNIDKLIEFFKNPDSQLKLEIENDVTEKYNEIIESELYVRELKPFYNSLIANFSKIKSEIEKECSNEKKLTENQFLQEREKERANSIEDKTIKMKKLIKEYQESFNELKDKLDISLLLKFNNIIRRLNSFANRASSLDHLIKSNDELLNDFDSISKLLEQENNKDMISLIKELEIIKEKLIKIKYYQKYKEIKSKFGSKSFSYSGLKDLDEFVKIVEETINIFDQYEFSEDDDLKDQMNKKFDEFKEILQDTENIKILYDNYILELNAKKFLNDSKKNLEESESLRNEKKILTERIDSMKEENIKNQTEIDDLKINIEEIKKESTITEDEKNNIESKIKELKEKKLENEKKEKERKNLKNQAKENIISLQSLIEDINQKLIPLLESQDNEQGEKNYPMEENDESKVNNQEFGKGKKEGINEEENNKENSKDKGIQIEDNEELHHNENEGNNQDKEGILIEGNKTDKLNMYEKEKEKNKNEENSTRKKREEEIADYIKQINKLQEEKKTYETILEVDDMDLATEGIDLVAITESINELEAKLMEYNEITSKINEIYEKIDKLSAIINDNNKKIENLEKDILKKENELSLALNNYNKNKSLGEKEYEKIKDIDITRTKMKNKELSIKNLKEEAFNLRELFKNHQDKIKLIFDSKTNQIYRDINNSSQIVTPSYLFENIQKKSKDFFLKEYNEFSNIYSKIYDIYNKFSNLFTNDSLDILLSKEKVEVLIVSYSYPEGNTQDKVCQVSDKYDNSIPIKPKKSEYIFLNPNIYEKNIKKIVFHQYQFEARRNVRKPALNLKLIDVGHEIKTLEFFMIDDSKIDEAIEKNLEEIKRYDYKKDCPNLQFGIGQNLKNENEFFQMLDEYFKKAKCIEKIFCIFEDDKNNKSINGIKGICGDIEKMIKDLYSITTEVKNHCKVEFTNTLYKCLGTQGKIDDLNNKISQLEEYIKKLLILINSKNLILKVNKLKTIKDDYEFFHKNLRLFLPEEIPSNKTVDFSELNEKSDLLKLPIISIVNNVVTCSYPNLKLSFGPYIASLYKEPIKINFTSLVRTLSMSIKDIENQYRSLLKCYVNNSNGLAQLEITIPKISNEEKDKEIISIKCKIEFNSPGSGNCLLDCEFNIEIIPFNAIIYCIEYNMAKKSDDNYILCLTQIAAGTPIHFCLGNYNIDKELKYTYQLESLENNSSEKPEIQRKKGNLEIVLGNKDEISVKRLVCQLIFNFSDSMKIKVNIDCFLIPFNFKFEIYDYNSKAFSNNLDVYLKGKYDFVSRKSQIRPNLVPLHFQVIFPNYSYKGKIDISYSKYSKCIKIEKTDNIPKIFDKNFKFNCNLIIDESIFIYDDRTFKSELREKSFVITLKIMNISNSVNINFKIVNKFIKNDKFDLININAFGLERYYYNKEDRWESIPKSLQVYNYGNYVSLFGFEPSIYLSYRTFDRRYKEYLDIRTHLSNELLKMNSTKKYLFFADINFEFDDKKYYYYDNNYHIAILGYVGNSKDLWYPAFYSYDDSFLKIQTQNKKYKDVLEKIKKMYLNDVTNEIIKGDFSVLAYALSVLGSEWDYKDKKKYLKILLEKILDVLNKNIYKVLGEIYIAILNEKIDENSLNKAFYNLIKALYNIFKERFIFITRNNFAIISAFLNQEKINKKAGELMEKYFFFNDSISLDKKYINNSFQKINKSISDANEMLKLIPKLKNKAIIYKEGGKSLLSDKTNTNFALSTSSLNKGEDLSKISNFKAELMHDLKYPPKWSILSLNDFFMKSIKLTRELPLFAISAKLENNTQSLNNTEKLYVKLLDLFQTTPEKDESFIGELVMTFNDQFTKMTNNLLFSNIMFKEGILPKKLRTNTDKLAQSNKQYIIIPKEVYLNDVQEKQWETNFIKENKTVKKK
jgi:MoxR-like ATPase